MFLQLLHNPINVIHLLCIISITAKSTSAAATTGQQSVPTSSDPAAFSNTQTPPLQSSQSIPTVSTFVMPPKVSTSTTPVPIFNNQLHQTTSQRIPTTVSPLTIATQSPTTASLPSTTTTPQPSSISSMFVAKQQLPTVAPETDSLSQSRSQTQSVSNGLSNNAPTPSSTEEFSFTTFSPDATTFGPNKSFEDPVGENEERSPHSSMLNNSSLDRTNFDESHHAIMEPSQNSQSQPAQDRFPQPAHPKMMNQDLQLSNAMRNASSVPPTNSTQVLQSSNMSSPISIQNVSSHPDSPSSANNLQGINNHEGHQSVNNQPIPEGRSQSFPDAVSPSLVLQNSSSNATSVLDKKVQLLKPKSKFKCTQPSDCHNDALCHNEKCFCLPGFTGESCDINIDECRQADGPPCLNNGICVDEVNGFRCDCPPGFRGERCQDLADMCIDLPCLNNAICVNHRTYYTCNCEPGWEGKHCEINTDDCAKSPCQNGATCQDLVNGYKCECPHGFAGVDCEINVDDCATSPCQNNATCRDLTNDYECECAPGFVGKNCEENIDECASSPCGLHGQCTDLINGFRCDCHDGWTGKQCEHDINECESGRPVCLNGGACVNLDGSYQCSCRDGFTGRKCSEISDFCKAKQPCGKNGICKNLNSPKSPFQCECYSGYVGSRCERKRDCDSHECSFDHAHCVNNVTCACLPGRREERIMCEYVASCDQVEGELCLHGGICKDLESGGYNCACQDPWYGPVCQFRAETQLDAVLLVVITCVGFLVIACAVVSLVIFRSVRKARATRGTYSPSTQEKFGNSASDLLKPPIPERLI